jgi:murein DD-endopeptidase MepM/ murein hydrolase activator NlpD
LAVIGLRLPAAILVLLLLIGVMPSDIGDLINNTQGQLNGINGKIGQMQTELGKLAAEDRALKGQIAALDSQLVAVANQIQEEQGKLQVLKDQVDAAKVQLAQKEAELADHIAQMGARMRHLYKSGQVSGIELVFSAVNFVDLLNRALFFADIVREDNRQVDQLRLERRVVAGLKADLEVKQAEQAAVVASIRQQQAQLQSIRVQQAAAEQRVAVVEALVQRELDAMEAQRAAVRQQLQELVAESLGAHSSGHFMWPLEGVLTQGFGCTSYPFEPYEPSCPYRHFHSGIDIAAGWGTAVRAADGGFVHNFTMACSWTTAYLCGYGHYVIIVHANGFATLYGHLSNYAQANGSEVVKGEVIGYEGSTGNSTGAHLHFEIDINGTPVNPLIYLP